ncbi:protein FAR1-RELATED SEQUENCE 3-like [Trifolium pratense]|uniref:protein FAR1-RELATED SEQUENCE 3-like n=1 Tax=Trifolium pratense TaxID=57577 RepID=UPI001E6937E7|nr:protein FAR1-RELATED SEQUENCE 3-like [Trifolium pratense]
MVRMPQQELQQAVPQQRIQVLACLRWLIRRYVYQNLNDDQLLKLFPRDLSLHLQTILLRSFQKNRDCWKQDLSSQQDLLSRTSVSYQVTANVPPSFSSAPSSSMSTSLWPRQDGDSLAQMNCGNLGLPTPLVADVNVSGLPACFQSSENLVLEENFPSLKSMTWTMENRGSSPADRVAIISLKLHDYSKSPLGETEVKFQVTRDTLEAMLRSMTYISEQLRAVPTSSRLATKKQKQ